ncbi:rna-directed dna polymerase from mobile element hypothetical protein [Limosa lapponica baueri]|uniref:Rna-directed dna polymerase from mobile element jockey-like n=1 Tax=Limosa lapponica baueri TaxID=1758121 RepID=A0A2I0T4I3_LIMLA|nr:rna-directed dna polymerase from mobile element hypothetical protein [Limosa lapponica baueri]
MIVMKGVKFLWVRIRGKANKADIMVGVCYRPPNQDQEADELFYKQLGEVSQSLPIVLVGPSTYQISAENTIEGRENSLGGSWRCGKQLPDTVAFSSKTSCSQGTNAPELDDRDGEQNEVPRIQGKRVSDLLQHLDIHKSMGPNGIHPRVLRELAEMLTKPFFIIYQESWLIGGVPVDWRLANVRPIHKKGHKEDAGNNRPVSLTSVPGKVVERIILGAITQHPDDWAQSAWVHERQVLLD